MHHVQVQHIPEDFSLSPRRLLSQQLQASIGVWNERQNDANPPKDDSPQAKMSSSKRPSSVFSSGVLYSITQPLLLRFLIAVTS